MKKNNLKNTLYLSMACGIAAVFLVLPIAADAADTRTTEIRITTSGYPDTVTNFYPYTDAFKNGAAVASCDLDGNGYEEIITGAGPGGGPQVRIFDSLGESKFTPGFFAYDEEFRGGINVACGDLDHDGTAEIVTAPQSNGGPHVRIFDRYGRPKFTPGFFAYDEQMKGGVNVAVGDLDGAGLPEIIVAPASSQEPRVYAYNRFGERLSYDIMPFHEEFGGGVSLAVLDVDGDSRDELAMAVQRFDIAWVKVMRIGQGQAVLGEFSAFPETFKGGVNIAGGDIDRDGYDEVIAAANSNGGPHVRAFEAYGKVLPYSYFAYEHEFRGGVLVGSGDINNDGYDEVIAAPLKKVFTGKVTSIIVDLSEQRLYAYEGDTAVKTFLVSTGLPSTPTRPGNFSVSQKVYSKLYSGQDFYLPNTLWNMRFDGSRLLHGAYWHNNFGHRMSHGCVNIAYPDAEWLYNATDIGTPVTVRQ